MTALPFRKPPEAAQPLSTAGRKPGSGKADGKSPGRFRPYKPRRYGTPKELVSRLADELGGIRALAELIGVKVTQAAAYTDPACEGKEMRLEQVHRAVLARPEARCVAEHFAALAGGVFCPVEPSDESLAELLARAEANHGQLLSRFLRVLEDGQVTEAERAELLPDLDAVLAALVEVRAVLARGEPQP